MDLEFNTVHRYRYSEESKAADGSGLFKAQDLVLNRDVALKEVKILGDSARELQKNYARASQEVRTMVQISERTSHIPNIYESYWDKDISTFYIIMQWINGESLADKIRRGEEIASLKYIDWMLTLCEILKEMDKKHFYHKDIKPQNIMLDFDDNLYLIDFNLSVSTPNMYEGTIEYKAPEMDYGSTTVDRSKVDMFSIGVMLYQFFTHLTPRRGGQYEIRDLDANTWTDFIEPKDINPDINETINIIIKKLMAYNPKERYHNYSALMSDLRQAKSEIRKNKKYYQ